MSIINRIINVSLLTGRLFRWIIFFCTTVGLEYIKYLMCLMLFLFIDPSDLGIVVTDASVQSVSFVHYASLVYM